MGYLTQRTVSFVTTDVPETGVNTETVVNTLNNVMTQFPGQVITLKAWCALLAGTTPTSVTLRIRRGGLAGVLVSEVNSNAGDIVTVKISTVELQCQDTPGDGVFPYVLTVQGVGEAAVSTANASMLEAQVG